MAVGAVQLFDLALYNILGGTTPLWTVAASWYACLYRSGTTTPLDSMATRGALTHTEVTTADYTRQAIASATISSSGTPPQSEFKSAIINYGNPVTISAKYLVVFQGTAGSPAAGDETLFWVNLDTTDTTSTEVSSTAAAFTIDDSANGWFFVGGQ